MHPSGQQNEAAIPVGSGQLPYRFDAACVVSNKAAETGHGDYYDEAERAELARLRHLYPEVSHWGDIALGIAWGDYCEDVWMLSWETITASTKRTVSFLDYLCWRQTRGEFPRGAGEETAAEAREWMRASMGTNPKDNHGASLR